MGVVFCFVCYLDVISPPPIWVSFFYFSFVIIIIFICFNFVVVVAVWMIRSHRSIVDVVSYWKGGNSGVWYFRRPFNTIGQVVE